MFQRLNVLEELYPKVDVPTSSLVGDHEMQPGEA